MKRLKRFFVLSHEWNVFLVLLLFISISLLSWWLVKVHLEKEWTARLNSEVEKVSSVVSREFYGYGDAMRDAKAFFQLGGLPTPEGFESYVDSAQLLERFRGLQGMAFAQALTKNEIPELEMRMRTAGYEEFKVWPAANQDLHTAITLIQPEDWRNKKALGFDMYSEPVRQKAMQTALASKNLAMTDPIMLVQDEPREEHPGFLIYLPVFKSPTKELGSEPSLMGFIYAIVRVNQFFNGSLGVPDFYNEKVNYHIRVRDAKSEGKILYERFPSSPKETDAALVVEKNIEVFDKVWTLHFEPLPHFYNWYERYIPVVFAILTLVMLSVIFLALWSTQQFLKISEKNKESLAQASKSKSRDILLFRKLNNMIADLSGAIESHSLFDKFCFHLEDMFQVEQCLIYVREQKGSYEKRFQNGSKEFPETLPLTQDFDDLISDGVYPASHEELKRYMNQLPEEFRHQLMSGNYYLMRTVMHESGQASSILVLVQGPPQMCETKMSEYILLRIFGQFATSYDKAILLRRAEDANLMKSSFLANMSHEIRTPLGVIIGYSEMLAQEEVSAQKKTEIVQHLKRSGKDLARLIDDILDISKVEAGKLHFEVAQVNLENLIHEIKSIMGVRATDKHIQFHVAKLSNVPSYVMTDDIRLKQILINIVGNAIKFTEKGSVKLLYSVWHNDQNQAFLDFQVQDTGIGISEQGRGHLFKAFSQGDVTTTRKYGGTGLGLALSKRLAELLGGELFLLESSVGKGSTFCLRIPLKELSVEVGPGLNVSQNAKVVERPVMSTKQSGVDWKQLDLKNLLRGNRILLVEDSEDNQQIFTHFLKSSGAEVLLAEDGVKAVDSALSMNPQLILMDIQIPKIDGKEATRKIRQKGYQGPIIALTAHALHEEMRSCLAAGCNGQITKPVAGELLVQEVYFYLNHRG